MIALEDWAEIRRLHRAEGMPIKEIARRLGLARNTVRAALRAEGPPSRERGPRGSAVDEVESAIRALLAEFPRMPATVIAERIGWTRSLTILKDRVRELRPLFTPPDPTDRVEYSPGEVAQCGTRPPPRPPADPWTASQPRPATASYEPSSSTTCGPRRPGITIRRPRPVTGLRVGRPPPSVAVKIWTIPVVF